MPSEDETALPPPVFMCSVASTVALIALSRHDSIAFSRTEFHVGTKSFLNPGSRVLPTLERHHLVEISGGDVRLARTNPFYDEIRALLAVMGKHYPVRTTRHLRTRTQIQRRAHTRRPVTELFGDGAASDELLMVAAIGAASVPILQRLGLGLKRQVQFSLKRFRRMGMLSEHYAGGSKYNYLNPEFVAAAELRALLNAMLHRAKTEFLGTAAVVRRRDPKLQSVLAFLGEPRD